jgi:hypothetical protein
MKNQVFTLISIRHYYDPRSLLKNNFSDEDRCKTVRLFVIGEF